MTSRERGMVAGMCAAVLAVIAGMPSHGAAGAIQGVTAHTTKPGKYYSAPGMNRVFDDEMMAQSPLMKGQYSSFICYVHPLPKAPIIVSLATGPCGKPIDFAKGLQLTLKETATASITRPFPVTAAYEQTCVAVRFEIEETAEQAVNCTTEWEPAVIKKGGEV